jgi:hypothetical protein
MHYRRSRRSEIDNVLGAFCSVFRQPVGFGSKADLQKGASFLALNQSPRYRKAARRLAANSMRSSVV